MKTNASVTIEYPFYWLDETLEYTLNPERQVYFNLRFAELELIEIRFEEEVKQVLASLKNQLFNLSTEEEIELTIRQYKLAVNILTDQAKSNFSLYTDSSLHNTGEVIFILLEDLNRQLNKRYPSKSSLSEMAAPLKTILPAQHSISKIICSLSVDQMGIILKAADDAKIIIAKSLSTIFRTLVPFLSSENKSNLSWDSMRSNSYHPEDNDKLIAIAALQKMIKKISEY